MFLYFSKLFKYIFNGANIFLLIIVCLTVFNSILEYRSYIHKLSTVYTQNVEILILDRSFENFGVNEYNALVNRNIYRFYHDSYLEIGVKYRIQGDFVEYDLNMDSEYKKYLLYNGVVGEINDIHVLERNHAENWQYKFLSSIDKVRQGFANKFYSYYCMEFVKPVDKLDVSCMDVFALSYGLVLGGTDNFTDDMKDRFKDLGLYHLVAVSGFQVVLIVTFLEIVLNKIRVRPKLKFLIASVSLVSFIVLVGFEPPILRSFISVFLSLAILAWLGRRISTFRSLVYSAIILLWINPLYLWSVSFQLSFLATLGVILAGFNYSETDWKVWKKIKTIILTSLYAFLFTLPIIIGISGKVTFLSVVANIFIVPLIPLITVLNIFGVGLDLLLYISGWLQGSILSLVNIFYDSTINQKLTLYSEGFGVLEVVLYYLMLVVSIVFFKVVRW